MPVALDARLGQLDVAAHGGERGQGEAQGVAAVLVDHLQRVDDVARGLGHLLAVLVADQGVDVDVLEGHVVHELQAHHHHAGHPEKEDVEARDQERGRVEGRKLMRLLGPAHGREGPQGRGEPGVEDVLVLGQVGAAACAGRRVLTGHDDLAAVPAGPDRDAVAPPQLARDAPVADVVQPVEVGLVPLGRPDGRAAVLHRGPRLLGQGLDGHEPLLGHEGLDGRLAAVALVDLVLVGLLGHQGLAGPKILDDERAALGGAQAAILLGRVVVHAALVVDDADGFQAVLAAQLPVVHVVGRGDLEAAGAELAVHVGVGDDRDAAAHQGQDDELADHVLVALVLGVHGHGRVAEHGLGADRGHGDEARTVLKGVAQVVERGFGRGVLDLVVGQGRVAAGAPVDDVLAAVDEALLVEGDEDFAHGLGQALVHGEALAGPVDAGAQAADLVQDASAVVLLPFPDALDEGLASQILAALAFGQELAFHHVLGGDARVVRARHPEDGLAVLAHEAAHDVLQGDVQGVAHVQGPGHVGRRDDDGVVVLRVRGGLGRVGRETLVRLPVVEPAPFHVGGFVSLGKRLVGHMMDSSELIAAKKAPGGPARRKQK
ncbi:hypothetical protein DSECCO2_570890 [anaerobic digester metagenome]